MRAFIFLFIICICTPNVVWSQAPTTQASNITFSAVTSTSITVNFVNGNGSSRLVVVKPTGAASSPPVDFITYSSNPIYGSGSHLGSGNYVVGIGSGPISVTNLTSGSIWDFQVYEFNGIPGLEYYNRTTSTFNPASRSTLVLEPNIQASGISFSNVTSGSITVNFINGNGSSRLLVAADSPFFNTDPEDGTSYTANSQFGVVELGTGGTGDYIVGSGSGPLTVVGLVPSYTYYFRVYEFNGSGGSENYNVSTTSDNPASQATLNRTFHISPTGNDSNDGSIASPKLTIQNALATATNGDIIKVAAGTYDEGLITQSQITLQGGYTSDFLDVNRNIFTQKAIVRAVSTIMLNDANGCVIDGFIFDGNNTAEVGLNISAGSVVRNNVVLRVKSSPGQGINISGNATVVNNNFHDNITGAIIFGGTSATSIFKNNIITNNSFGLNNSSAAGIHRYTCVFGNSFNYTGNFNTPGTGDINLNPQFLNAASDDFRLATTSPAIDAGDPADPVGSETCSSRINMGAYGGTLLASCTVASQPGTQASNITFSSVTTTSVTVNYTNGDGTSRMLVARAGSAVNSDPVDGTTYTTNNVFESGSEIGTGNFVVGNGSGPVTVTGLTPGTTYHFRLYEFNGSAGAENYNPTTGTNNPNSSITIPEAPIASSATSIDETSFIANWAASAGASNYFLDVSTSNDFAAFVAGYNNLSVGNVTNYSVSTNLSSSSTYYFRIRASNSSGASANSNIITLTTLSPAGWTAMTSSTTQWLQAVFFANQNTGYAVGYTGTIIKSTNGGLSWTNLVSGTVDFLHGVFFTDENTGYVVGQNGKILKTINGGTTWVTQTSGTTQWLWDVFFTDASTGYVVGSGGVLRKTIDGGSTWTALSSGTTNPLYDIYFLDSNTGYAIGGSGTIRKTTNAGSGWTTLTTGTTTELLGIDFTDVNIGYIVGYNGRVFKTTDAGAVWSETSWTLQNLNAVRFIDANTGFAVGVNGLIIKTVNGGVSWTVDTSGTTDNLEDLVFTSSQKGIAVGLDGTIVLYQGTGPAIEPIAQPTNIYFTNQQSTQFTVNFDAAVGNPDGYIAFMKEGSSPTFVPVDGSVYQFNEEPDPSGDPGTYTVLNDVFTSFNIVSVTPGATLFFDVYAYNGSGSSINYLTSIPPLENSFTTPILPSEPTVQARDIIITQPFVSTLQLNWTNGNGASRIVVAKEGATVDMAPSDGFTYLASASFTSGDDLGGGNYVVYNGNGNSVTVTDIQSGTMYTFFVFEYNGNAGSENYNINIGTSDNPKSFSGTGTDTTPPVAGTDSTPSSVPAGSSINVLAQFSEPESPSSVSVTIEYRSVSSGSAPTSQPMVESPQGTWTFTIPSSALGEIGAEYRMKARSTGGEITTEYKNVKIDYASSDGLAIPYTSFGDQQSNYRIVSVPLDLTSKTVGSVFGTHLGAYDGKAWRMYRWNNGVTTELTSSTPIEPGKGYWLIIRENKGLELTSGAGTTVATSSVNPFTLQNVSAEWYQVGNPYPFNLLWADVQAANPGLPGLRIYEGSFADGTVLKKFSGGFFKLAAGSPSINLEFPVVKNPSAGRIAKHDLNSIDQSNWSVKLNFIHGSLNNSMAGIGMHENASDGFDVFDGFTMPRIFDEFLEVNHHKKDGESPFTFDVVPTTANRIWEFSVISSGTAQRMMVQWDNSYFGNSDRELYLMDLGAGRYMDMRNTNQYVFDAKRSGPFKIIYGDKKFVEENTTVDRLILHDAFPVPADQELTLAFSLPSLDRGLTTLEMIDLMGRISWRMENEFSPGYNEVVWKRTTEASGIYLIRVKSGALTQQKRIIIR